MAVGFAGNKSKVLDKISNAKFSSFILQISLPSLIISSAIGQPISDKRNVFIILALAIGMFIIIPIISALAVRFFKWERTFELMLNYSNLGFMGFPIMLTIYGKDAVFYASLFLMIFNLSIFSHGVMILNGANNKSDFSIKKLLNAGTVSALIALVIFLFQIPLPSMISDILSVLGGTSTPLAMIVIGSTLAEINLLSVFTDKKLYVFSFLKLIIYPMVLFLIYRLFVSDVKLITIAAILCALPIAGNVSMLSIKYGGNVELVTKGICMSTLLSIVTVPFVIYLIGLI